MTRAPAVLERTIDVFLTVDVEVWCNGWSDLDASFSGAFERYVYGRTPEGDRGLAYQARVLQRAGLCGVFFVEPLFAERFGHAHLREIVQLLLAADQEVQLHLHPEWADELEPPMVPMPPGGRVKRPLLRQYSAADQQELIARGMALLEAAGAGRINAFRAGSFGFDLETLSALRRLGIPFDSSYNATMYGPDSGVGDGGLLLDVYRSGPVTEVPMTVFNDGFGRLRHAQLGACSWAELEAMLWQALEQGRSSFVILLHNFELLTPDKSRPDPVVMRRFQALTRFLDRHRDRFPTRGFHAWVAPAEQPQPSHLLSTRRRTCWRVLEQTWRRGYR